MIVYSRVSSVEWSATFPGPRACDTEGANTIGRIRLCLSLLFWWKLLDFPWLLVALVDLTGKVQVVGYCLNSCISSDFPVQIQ